MDIPKHKRCECEWKQKDGQTYYSGCGDSFWQPDGEDPIKTTMGVCPFCCEKIVMIDESKYGAGPGQVPEISQGAPAKSGL